MIVLHLACVLVSLLSFSTAALMTDDCSQLIQHLTPNELHQILGRWIIIEGFSNNELFDSILKSMESAWIKLSTTADNKTLLLDQANRLVPQLHQTSLPMHEYSYECDLGRWRSLRVLHCTCPFQPQVPADLP
ncbi:hypothetical protein ABVT39_015006 [Epinephelus coioides]